MDRKQGSVTGTEEAIAMEERESCSKWKEKEEKFFSFTKEIFSYAGERDGVSSILRFFVIKMLEVILPIYPTKFLVFSYFSWDLGVFFGNSMGILVMLRIDKLNYNVSPTILFFKRNLNDITFTC